MGEQLMAECGPGGYRKGAKRAKLAKAVRKMRPNAKWAPGDREKPLQLNQEAVAELMEAGWSANEALAIRRLLG